MKKLLAVLMMVVLISSLSACNEDQSSQQESGSKSESSVTSGNDEDVSDTTTTEPHVHSFADATCTDPKTCTDCEATEGSALGHNYADATCTEPKICTVCEATEGSALGHNYENATCTEPQTCTVCEATEGSALGHKYADATCKTPKTCTVCKATEGGVAAHKYASGKCTVCGVADPAASLLSSGSYGTYEALTVDDKEGMLIRYTVKYNGSKSVTYSLVQYEEVPAAESEIKYNGKNYRKWVEVDYSNAIKNVKVTDNTLSFNFTVEGFDAEFGMSFEYKDGALCFEKDFGAVVKLTRK